jgi:hypothetical protein
MRNPQNLLKTAAFLIKTTENLVAKMKIAQGKRSSLFKTGAILCAK